jgi:hypothetical protein
MVENLYVLSYETQILKLSPDLLEQKMTVAHRRRLTEVDCRDAGIGRNPVNASIGYCFQLEILIM